MPKRLSFPISIDALGERGRRVPEHSKPDVPDWARRGPELERRCGTVRLSGRRTPWRHRTTQPDMPQAKDDPDLRVRQTRSTKPEIPPKTEEKKDGETQEGAPGSSSRIEAKVRIKIRRGKRLDRCADILGGLPGIEDCAVDQENQVVLLTISAADNKALNAVLTKFSTLVEQEWMKVDSKKLKEDRA